VEGAAGDEQDVVGLDGAVLGRDRRALDQRQQVALHALAADVGADSALARADLVDLVEEHDAVLLGGQERLARDPLLVEQLVALLGDQHVVALGHGHAPLLQARALAPCPASRPG
jgi:hypothetical protein